MRDAYLARLDEDPSVAKNHNELMFALSLYILNNWFLLLLVEANGFLVSNHVWSFKFTDALHKTNDVLSAVNTKPDN